MTEKTAFEKPTCSCGQRDSSIHRIMCRLNVIDIDKFIRRVNGKLKTLRTHRPLREVIIQVMRGQNATPWGLRKGNLEKESLKANYSKSFITDNFGAVSFFFNQE